MWTDAQLQKEYQYCGERTEKELYRLARIGLAAEQVKDLLSMNHEDLTAEEFSQAQAFFSHPAWRKP